MTEDFSYYQVYGRVFLSSKEMQGETARDLSPWKITRLFFLDLLIFTIQRKEVKSCDHCLSNVGTTILLLMPGTEKGKGLHRGLGQWPTEVFFRAVGHSAGSLAACW